MCKARIVADMEAIGARLSSDNFGIDNTLLLILSMVACESDTVRIEEPEGM
jgi:hypothetical protein